VWVKSKNIDFALPLNATVIGFLPITFIFASAWFLIAISN
jgi:hypothetical protein